MKDLINIDWVKLNWVRFIVFVCQYFYDVYYNELVREVIIMFFNYIKNRDIVLNYLFFEMEDILYSGEGYGFQSQIGVLVQVL